MSSYSPSPHKPRGNRVQRTCLKCGKLFYSTGPGNRICPGRCTAENAGKYGTASVPGNSGRVNRGRIGSSE